MYTIYTYRAKVPAPIYDHLIDHPVEAQLNTLSVRGSLKVCTFDLQTWDPETVSFLYRREQVEQKN